MKLFILVGGSSRTTGDLIKPKKNSKKEPKTGQKRANFNEAADVVAMIRERRSYGSMKQDEGNFNGHIEEVMSLE